MSTVTFDGYDLTTDYIVGNLVRSFSARDIQQIDVPGMDGAIFASANYEPVTITMDVTAISSNPTERSNALRRLAEALSVREPAQLAISDDGGKYYLAIPNGGDLARYKSAETFPLEFTALDPVMYGDSKTATVPSGGSVTITVGGNYRTMPSISASAARCNSTTKLWTLTFDNIAFEVKCPNTNATAITADSEHRNLVVAGNRSIPTLGSDWPVLEPGTHTVRNSSGSGACTLTWRERWL